MQKNVLITGATSGIGAALADVLAENGYSLALVARDKERLAERAKSMELRHKVRCLPIPADLSDPSSPGAIFKQLQQAPFPVFVLVNNAGSGVFGPFAEADSAKELAMLQLNMVSVVQLTKFFLKPMLDKREGKILNVASTTAFQPGPYLALYSASKAFVHSFSCALAVELDGTGVTVTSLCPGGTETDFQQRAGMKTASGFKPMTARAVAEIGFKAMMQGKPEEIAGLKNKIMVAVSKRAPTMLSARAAARVNRGR